MQKLTALIRADREYQGFLDTLRATFLRSEELFPIAVNGLSGGAEEAFIAESVEEALKLSPLPCVIFTGSDTERDKIVSRLCDGGIRAMAYKRREPVFHNIRASHDVERERLSVLFSLISGECDAVVTTPSAALSYTMPRSVLSEMAVRLSVGTAISPEELSKRLSSLGFAYVEAVEGRGQFSRRGGIVDFFGGDADHPVRIEFFGDEIDRLVYFDAISQRTLGECDGALLLPECEMLLSAEARARILKSAVSLRDKATDTATREKLARECAVLESDMGVDFRDRYMGLIYPEQENLLGYLSSDKRGVAFVVGSSECDEELSRVNSALEETRRGFIDSGLITESIAKYSGSASDYSKFLDRRLTVYENPFAGGLGSKKLSGLFGFRCRRTVSYGGNPSMLREDLISFRKSGYRTLILTENKQGADSLAEALAAEDIAAQRIYDSPDFDITAAEGGRIFITTGHSDGFDLMSPRIAVISMARDEGRAVMKHRKTQRILKQSGAPKRLMSYAELTPGDYVVHANCGIGLFEGIETVTAGGMTKDYITIRYAGTDKLFVPCDRLEMIGKYIGAREKDGTVKLSKMGGGDWNKSKAKAKAAARNIADELIKLYAERQRLPGFAFPADSELEYAFASAFGYEETESQATAINEIIEDMMKPVPMNRLLCGDVGFGKTEVALRAAFKAIMGGKQVAILVPTTILALQHYQTALSRTRGFPVTVEMLSRFKKPKEQEEIIRKVKRGECDILIGTHTLLSKRIEFRDLGLLIIDEEQRFGVAQKEKLKSIAKNVDTLTLTATPIPRTLNMAINGISDISILDEAPGERRPVQTYVLEHNELLVMEAIRREMARGGQTLYLYNKVEDIDLVAGNISRHIPEARVGYAHGQMDRDEIEDIWQLLVRCELDVLVCTTIIETGVDLPMANTLIIENADRFGLSQLHQIRGRVGRSTRQAYAYFTYRPGKVLTEVAEKRLKAIKEYAEFGAGFKIALCDLEIRGAGNLLGAEQHGYIDSVGYDLYVKLLSEAVLEAKGEEDPAKKKTEAHIDIQTSAYIPESYISSGAQRMEMYKKISLILTEEDEGDVLDELIDRYGDPPRSVQRLTSVALTKALCERAGIERVSATDTGLTFIVGKPDLAAWSEVFAKFPGMRFGPSGDRVVYRFSDPKKTDAALLAAEIMKEYGK